MVLELARKLTCLRTEDAEPREEASGRVLAELDAQPPVIPRHERSLRSALRLCGRRSDRVEPRAQPRKLAALGLEHLAVDLDQDAAAVGEMVGRARDQTPVVVEA